MPAGDHQLRRWLASKELGAQKKPGSTNPGTHFEPFPGLRGFFDRFAAAATAGRLFGRGFADQLGGPH